MIRLQPRSPARLGATVAVAVAVAIAAIPQVAVAVIAFPVLSLLTGPTQFGRRPRPSSFSCSLLFLISKIYKNQKPSRFRFVQYHKNILLNKYKYILLRLLAK